MSLSINKLHKILYNKGIVQVRHFIYDKKYYLIEGITSHSESIIINISGISKISKKLNFSVDKDSEIYNNFKHYKLKKLPLYLSNNIVEKYGENIESKDYYDELFLYDNGDIPKNIEHTLLENYNNNITIDAIKDNDLEQLKEIYRQLSRLKNCVKFINYNLSIITAKSLCIINDKDGIDCYHIKNSDINSTYKKLYTVINLDHLIKIDHDFEKDILDINQGIKKLLNKNQLIHISKLNTFMDKKLDIQKNITNIDNLKKKSDNTIFEYQKILFDLTKKEEELIKELKSIKLIDTKFSIQKDISKTYNIEKLEEEINKIKDKKDEVTASILELQDYMSNITLTMDSILFDNIVLLNTIHNNIDKLRKILS